MSPVLAKTAQVFALAMFAFIFGGYSFLLSGACTDQKMGGWVWVAMLCSIVGMAVVGFRIVRGTGAFKA
jgi:hypothetical protein